jgi:hypothetical protein
MPINIFFIVKNHWEPSFTDNPRKSCKIFCPKKTVPATWFDQVATLEPSLPEMMNIRQRTHLLLV